MDTKSTNPTTSKHQGIIEKIWPFLNYLQIQFLVLTHLGSGSHLSNSLTLCFIYYILLHDLIGSPFGVQMQAAFRNRISLLHETKQQVSRCRMKDEQKEWLRIVSQEARKRNRKVAKHSRNKKKMGCGQ